MQQLIEILVNIIHQLQITQDGNLPSKICVKCANLLIMWNDLVLNCIETDKKLTNVLEFSDQYYEMKLRRKKDREKEEFEKVLHDVLEKNNDSNKSKQIHDVQLNPFPSSQVEYIYENPNVQIAQAEFIIESGNADDNIHETTSEVEDGENDIR